MKRDPNPALQDSAVRLHIYRHFIETGRAPKIAGTAGALSTTEAEARSAYQRLAEAHALVLQANGEILRAAPFWAVPTRFWVEDGKRSWWGSCVWDALGIPAMLKQDARILTGCGCCDAAMELEVRRGTVAPAGGVIHFAVPARRWYDNVAFT